MTLAQFRHDDHGLLNQKALLMSRYLNDLYGAEPARFPLFTTGEGAWKYSRGGSWVGGLWVGVWALLGLLYKKQVYVERALTMSESLNPKLHEDSVHAAMIFWYGAGYPKTLLPKSAFERLALLGGEAVSMRFDSAMSCVPLGTALGGGELGKRKISADSLAALIFLLCRYGDASIAKAHLDTYRLSCVFDSGACVAEATFNPATQWSFKQAPGEWSRGQAWSALGLVAAACELDVNHAILAETALAYWWQNFAPEQGHEQNLPDDFDPSACLIALTAAYRLARLPGFEIWKQRADRLFEYLTRCEGLWWLEEPTRHLRFLSSPVSATSKRRCETVWGYYFFYEALWLSEM